MATDLIQSIGADGQIHKTNSSDATKNKKKSNDSLGKDAFLNLLVCQMQNQDPLNPNTDTEYIAQLATFSQVEEMQNIGKAMDNMRAMTSVGKYVDITVKDLRKNDDGLYEERNVTGKIDFATSENKISVNGKLYDFDDVTAMYNDEPSKYKTDDKDGNKK